jgi:hypothetical protein
MVARALGSCRGCMRQLFASGVSPCGSVDGGAAAMARRDGVSTKASCRQWPAATQRHSCKMGSEVGR